MAVSVRVEGGGIQRFADAAKDLASDKAALAYMRALNHTGAKANTRVRRALKSQTGLASLALVDKLGALGKSRAGKSRLSYEISSTGSHIPLHWFKAAQFGYGVRASPWGKTQRFPGTFIFAGSPRSGKYVSGGAVFHRVTTASLPIEKLYGPAIPKEMVKDQTADAFNAVAGDLPGRVAHEVKRMTGGAVS